MREGPILKSLSCLATFAFVGAVWGQQPVPEDLFTGATSVAGDELKTRLSGKSFEWSAPGSPVTAKIQYKANGEASIQLSNGQNDTGPWNVEGTQMCTEWRQLRRTCAREVRAKGELLFFRRGDGSWATMTPN